MTLTQFVDRARRKKPPILIPPRPRIRPRQYRRKRRQTNQSKLYRTVKTLIRLMK